jgi:hypothetical protein
VEAAEELSTACTAEVDRLRRNGANSQAATAALKTIRTAISRAKRAIQNNIPLFVSDEAGAPIPAGKLEAACNTAEGKAPEPKAVKETKEAQAGEVKEASTNPDPALVTRIAALEAAILDALRASSLKTAKAILKAAMSA